MKVFELARKHGIKVVELLEVLEAVGCDKRSTVAILDDDVVAEVEKILGPRQTPVVAVVPVEKEAVIGDTPNPPTAEKPKRVATTPWRPAKLVFIPEHLKNPNFTYRFVDTDRPGNVRKKLSEGWEIDKELSKKMSQAHGVGTIEDGSPVDGTYKLRELVVMRLPKERAEARKKFYAEKSETAIKDQEQHFKNQVGGQGYGTITEN